MQISLNLLLTSILLVIFSTQQTATFAHTRLISAVPSIGSEIESWPNSISLEFDEDLQNLSDEKVNFLVVNNAAGDQVSNDDEVLVKNTITVTLTPNLLQGPVLVYYRVVSTDGHPVEGEYKFTFGVGVETAEGVVNESKVDYPLEIYLTAAIFIILGLCFAIYLYRRRSG
jgi:methionine-rich copper-binding protein CopC